MYIFILALMLAASPTEHGSLEDGIQSKEFLLAQSDRAPSSDSSGEDGLDAPQQTGDKPIDPVVMEAPKARIGFEERRQAFLSRIRESRLSHEMVMLPRRQQAYGDREVSIPNVDSNEYGPNWETLVSKFYGSGGTVLSSKELFVASIASKYTPTRTMADIQLPLGIRLAIADIIVATVKEQNPGWEEGREFCIPERFQDGASDRHASVRFELRGRKMRVFVLAASYMRIKDSTPSQALTGSAPTQALDFEGKRIQFLQRVRTPLGVPMPMQDSVYGSLSVDIPDSGSPRFDDTWAWLLDTFRNPPAMRFSGGRIPSLSLTVSSISETARRSGALADRRLPKEIRLAIAQIISTAVKAEHPSWEEGKDFAIPQYFGFRSGLSHAEIQLRKQATSMTVVVLSATYIRDPNIAN